MLQSVADPQIRIGLKRAPQVVDLTVVMAQPTLLAAIKLCISLGGFQADKQVYGALDIDAGHWSRILRGEAHFPVDKLNDLMDLCGNEVPMIWLLLSRAYDPASLRKQESATERELRLAHDALEAERSKVRILTEALHGRVV